MELIEKGKRKIRRVVVGTFRRYHLDKYLYISYYHSIFFTGQHLDNHLLYFAARPNPGAGIGHQMANWIAGYWFAKVFDLNFAHLPFQGSWEEFLGFYQGEKTVKELKRCGYKIVRIPLFDEHDKNEVELISKIIKSYQGKKIVFLAEQDQFYHDQYGVMQQLKEKFYSAPIRKKEKLIYEQGRYNVAIHIRRGDIVQNNANNANLQMRYLDNGYYYNALQTALKYVQDKDNIHIYIFSQGNERDFTEFQQFENVHFCLDMDAQSSFLHMVYADVLITSRSSFSYKPALLNRGIKFCPVDFWHGYPQTEDWILLDENGGVVKKKSEI